MCGFLSPDLRSRLIKLRSFLIRPWRKVWPLGLSDIPDSDLFPGSHPAFVVVDGHSEATTLDLPSSRVVEDHIQQAHSMQAC